ncbi:MAG TPA: anti-sigma factor [Nitriliruptorales bacterium]
MTHADARRELGAYALGKLARQERLAVERHLADCPSCREELGALSSVRPLLDQLAEEDLPATMAADVRDVASLTRGLARARRRERRQLWAWRMATAAAAVALIATFSLDGQGPTVESEPLVLREVTAAGASVGGGIDATRWEWGTTVSLQLTSLPHRDGYVVWVVSTDGRREQAGTWGPTAAGGAVVRGASGIHVEEIAAVEITDADGNLLVAFERAATPA